MHWWSPHQVVLCCRSRHFTRRRGNWTKLVPLGSRLFLDLAKCPKSKYWKRNML